MAPEGHVDLLWIPLGAGGRVVPACGRAFETVSALRAGRPRRALFHAALEVAWAGERYVIEQAPVWNLAVPDRGVVAGGAVGAPALGRWRWFRYEVRCWRGGRIPDRDWALPSVRVADGEAIAGRVVALAPQIPAAVWGRDELGAGEMWNSNSAIAWLLERAGVDAALLAPPDGGRAPGWAAGVIVASRNDDGPGIPGP